ncbi:PREDICTED: zinc finger protein 839 [Elephantulus edwardii]|uniref:zinc finger protein 839 n=1 Tax=Elephantulus edwardii TaxID=28737 RepID=UPI0003F06E4C|nr:PREDICTED: zinc finger protein 839 [Elephantulus edwardii]
MADAGPEAEERSEDGGGGAPRSSGSPRSTSVRSPLRRQAPVCTCSAPLQPRGARAPPSLTPGAPLHRHALPALTPGAPLHRRALPAVLFRRLCSRAELGRPRCHLSPPNSVHTLHASLLELLPCWILCRGQPHTQGPLCAQLPGQGCAHSSRACWALFRNATGVASWNIDKGAMAGAGSEAGAELSRARAQRSPVPTPTAGRQLEAICVKVTPGEMRSPASLLPSLVTIQPRTSQPCSLSTRSPSLLGPGITGPQPLRIQPLPLQSHLSGPPQPPAQVFVRGPQPTLSPGSAKGAAACQARSGRRTSPAPSPVSDPPALTSVSPSSANGLLSVLNTQHPEKLRRSLEVKTRSGRISRPPKYKAKDYRFIKTEDLADGHLSDSDDYSELSVEEDEDERGKRALFDSTSCPLRPKTFKCETCEKSYIGKGGLARHFRLNPGHGHGPLEPAALMSERASGHVPQGCTGDRTASPGSPEPSVAILREEGVLAPCASEAETTEGRLQQSDQEDRVAPALSQLTPVVTVYEFLLMKVEQNHLAKPLFPAVYKEFEELHKMVKKMCQEYLSSSGPCSLEPLEISNSKVAESLGITEEFLRKRDTDTSGLSGRRACREADGVQPAEEAGGQKRGREAPEEALASEKRTRREPVPQDDTEPPTAPSRAQEEPRTACDPIDTGGRGPQVTRLPSQHRNEGHPAAGPLGGHSGLPAGQQPRTFAEGDAFGGDVGSSLALPSHSAQDTGEHSDLCSGLVSTGGPASLLPGGAGNAAVRAQGGACASHTDGWQPVPSTVTLTGVAAPKLETTLFPEAVLVDCTPRTASEPGPQPGPHGSQTTARDLTSHTGAPSEPSRAEEWAEQTELETTVAVGEAVAFEVTSECRTLCPQGQEIFIQTSEGLLLSHPGSDVTQEGVVLVAQVEGPALHEGLPPEGVPLEAVEAFLAGGTEPSP